MSAPKIVPDLLTLLTLSAMYPNGFATPHIRAGTPYALTCLLTSDELMRRFKEETRYVRHDAERLILLWEDPASVLDTHPDRPGVACACGKSVSYHRGGEHYRGDKP